MWTAQEPWPKGAKGLTLTVGNSTEASRCAGSKPAANKTVTCMSLSRYNQGDRVYVFSVRFFRQCGPAWAQKAPGPAHPLRTHASMTVLLMMVGV